MNVNHIQSIFETNYNQCIFLSFATSDSSIIFKVPLVKIIINAYSLVLLLLSRSVVGSRMSAHQPRGCHNCCFYLQPICLKSRHQMNFSLNHCLLHTFLNRSKKCCLRRGWIPVHFPDRGIPGPSGTSRMGHPAPCESTLCRWPPSIWKVIDLINWILF